MSDTTPRTSSPLLAASQAQKHVTHNEALLQFDALLCCRILDRDLAAPPASPADGDCYLVAAAPTGSWAGQAGNLAFSVDGGWRFYPPFAGLCAFIADELAMLVHTGAGWTDWASVVDWQNLPLLGIGTGADAVNKFALKSNAALFAALEAASGGTGDMRIAISKDAAAQDAGLVLQDGYSTRALIGLLGDDDLAVKVSSDGSTFRTGLSIDRSSGAVDHAQGAKFLAYVNYDQYVAAGAFAQIAFNSAVHNDQAAFDAAANRFAAPVAGTYALGARIVFKANAALPSRMMLALFVNGSEVAQSRAVTDAIADQGTTLETSACLKLAAGDLVDARVQFVSNDGYVLASVNAFQGARLA